MDWNKAKEILIAMFLIINIFLSYQLYTISRNQYTYINPDELQSVVEYLDTKNIQLETEIPDRVLIAPAIRIKYHEFQSNEIEKIFFSGEDVKPEGTAVRFGIENDNISIEVKNRIYLTYNDKGIDITQSDVNKDKCLNNAYSFINKLKLNSGNRYVKEVTVEKGYVRLILGQQFNNVPVESSEIEIYATEEGVSQATINWFEWIKTDKKHNIITPVIALLKAYEKGEKKDEAVVIKQIRQGYYFRPETKDSSEDINLEETISPMWVILSNRSEIYVNAYNENIEKTR
jgi:regulatory protein YycI of two-component signal transduction system YycFG